VIPQLISAFLAFPHVRKADLRLRQQYPRVCETEIVIAISAKYPQLGCGCRVRKTLALIVYQPP
jgi:hypothetical protein